MTELQIASTGIGVGLLVFAAWNLAAQFALTCRGTIHVSPVWFSGLYSSAAAVGIALILLGAGR